MREVRMIKTQKCRNSASDLLAVAVGWRSKSYSGQSLWF